MVSNFMYDKITKDTVFKNYSPEFLHTDIYKLPGLDKICIQAHTNTPGKRKFDKEHICYYCGTCVIKMGRHLVEQHKDKEEVKPILKMDKCSDERKNALTLLTLKGDFLHNCHVIKEQKGILLVLRRTGDNDIDPQEYIPCIYCLSFIKKASL